MNQKNKIQAYRKYRVEKQLTERNKTSAVRELNPTHVKRNKLPRTKSAMPSRLVVTTQDEIHILPFEEIRFIQSDGRYSRIFLSNGESIFTCSTLKQFCEKVPNDVFFRIHQSVLLNVNFVRMMLSTSVRLVCGQELPISRRRRKDFLAFIES